MTSHTEYIEDKTVEQLTHLIEVATKKRDDLKLGGWVSLWVVSNDANQAWFPKADYAGAIAYLTRLANESLESGTHTELAIEENRYRKYEADGLVAETQKEIAECQNRQ